jgi:hypothetical protein
MIMDQENGIEERRSSLKKTISSNGLAKQISISAGQIENADDYILRLQGHDAVLERQFSVWAALGLAFR